MTFFRHLLFFFFITTISTRSLSFSVPHSFNNNEINSSKTFNDDPAKSLTIPENTIIETIEEASKYLETFQFKKALKAALIAYKLAKEEKNVLLEINSLLLVAQINMYWENTDSSLRIYEKINSYRERLGDSLPQNFDLILDLGKSNVYLKSNKPNEALELIEKFFTIHKKGNPTPIYQDFLWNSGVAYFQKNKFQQAFDSLNKVVELAPSTYNEALLNYYKGSFYEQTANVKTALPFYFKYDTLISGQKEIVPESKELYETINSYFLEKGDRINQFIYLNKFLNTLTVQNDIAEFVKNTTSQQYEIPLLIEEKQIEIEKLKKQEIQNRRKTIIIISLLFFGIFISFYSVVKQLKYKKRFEKLIKNELKQDVFNDNENNKPKISIEVIRDLLKKLDEFESKKQFLANGISLNEVSKQFQTNSTYLSKVVNLKKDKNFSNYINDLRIEYCIKQLNKESKLRNYTIKALAEEMGFNNAQSFSTAFFKYTGIFPSFFIEQLKKSKKE